MTPPFHKIWKWLQIENITEESLKKKTFCYALLSWTTGDWYIGSTNRGFDRWKQHILDARKIWVNKHGKQKYKTMNVHKCMNRTGIQNWTMLPILFHESDIKRLEQKLIKRLKPTLNSLWTKNTTKGKRNRPLKKYHDNPNKAEGKGPITRQFTTFHIGSIPFTDLFQAIHTHIGQGNFYISWVKGALDSSNYTRLWKWFRKINGNMLSLDTNVETPLIFNSVNEMIHIIKGHDRGTILIKDFEVNKIITKYSKMARQISKSKTLPEDIDSTSIWKLFAAKRYIREKSVRQAVGKTLQGFFKKLFGFLLPKMITLKVPYDHNIKRNKIHSCALEAIDHTDLPDTAKKLLKNKVRVVFTKRRSIGDITLNHIFFAKHIKDITGPCVCKTLLQKTGKHYTRKVTESKIYVTKPLQQNKNNIPLPSNKDTWISINKALWISKRNLKHTLRTPQHSTPIKQPIDA